MTKEDIINMAREAGILEPIDLLESNQWKQDTIRELERFAALVAAAERARMAEQPAPVQQDHDCALKRGGILCRYCDLEVVEAEQPAQQEPVAEVVMAAKPPNAPLVWLPFKIVHASLEWLDSVPVGTKLYTSPPAQQEDYKTLEQALTRLQKRYGELEGKAQRTWVGLKADELRVILGGDHTQISLALAIEAKLRSKNT